MKNDQRKPVAFGVVLLISMFGMMAAAISAMFFGFGLLESVWVLVIIQSSLSGLWVVASLIFHMIPHRVRFNRTCENGQNSKYL